MINIHKASTALVSALLVASASSYIFHQDTIVGIRALGFPDFFRFQLAVMKMLAATVLLLPRTPRQKKEWAYAGVGFFCITAFVAHIAHQDPIAISLLLVLFFSLLLLSRATAP